MGYGARLVALVMSSASRAGELVARMEARQLELAVETRARQPALGACREIVEVQKIGQGVRCDQECGVALGRVAGRELVRFVQQRVDQVGLFARQVDGIVNLPSHMHRLRERAEIEADHRALEPALGVGLRLRRPKLSHRCSCRAGAGT